MVVQARSLQASSKQLVRISQLGKTSIAPADAEHRSHQPTADHESAEGAAFPTGPRLGSTARVRFLRKTYQQTRQFIGEDLESEGSEEDLDSEVVTSSDTVAPQGSGRRLSSLAKQLPQKEYLWRKVQAVAFGTRRAMQQRHRLLSTLKMSIQECVERQRVAKRIQETMMQDESGNDLLAGLRTSLDGTSIEMLEEIVKEARKFKVLKLPDFVPMVLDYAISDSEKAQQLLQDCLLDAVQGAMELGEDLFEMDERKLSRSWWRTMSFIRQPGIATHGTAS